MWPSRSVWAYLQKALTVPIEAFSGALTKFLHNVGLAVAASTPGAFYDALIDLHTLSSSILNDRGKQLTS
jgi:hypothetical protein